jgi:hypothetical protein
MTSKAGKAASFPLRLPVSMRRELNALAKREGISINHFISLAVAEKIVRCQRQPDVLQLPELGGSDHSRPVGTGTLVYGAPPKAESVRHSENEVALPPYSKACDVVAQFEEARGDASTKDQTSNLPDAQVNTSNGVRFVI